MGSANAIKKLDAEIKRSKEEVENMDLRRVICIINVRQGAFQVQITPSNHSRTNLGKVVLVHFWNSQMKIKKSNDLIEFRNTTLSFEPQKIFQNWVLYEESFILGFEGSKVNVGIKNGNF